MGNANITKVNINNIPKWFKAVFLLLPIAGIFLIGRTLDNDYYFLYTTGEYIVNNHIFPTTDILSMHSNMQIIVQQWLTDVIFYIIGYHFGKAGMIALLYFCYIILCILTYKLFKLVSNNFFVSATCAFIVDASIAAMYMVTRPQIFTYIIIICELLALEKFVKTKKAKYLLWLPLLSFLQINFHSSMWIMLFVFMAPYFAAAIPLNKGKLHQTPCCSFLKLLITAVVMLAVGLINPYGIKSIMYIFTSFGYEEISDLIIEMKPLAADTNSGKYIIIVIAISIAVMLLGKKTQKFNARFVLLYLGTMALAFITQKSSSYFFICGGLAIAYYLSDFSFSLKLTEENETSEKTKKTRIILIALIVIVLCLLVFKATDISSYIDVQYSSNNSSDTDEKSDYEILDEIVDLLPDDTNSIKLYTGFNYGQYMEYKGYHPYIDGRAELFLEDNNKEFNYMNEYYQLYNAKIYYQDFIDKYNFDYLIVYQGESYLYTSLMNDDNYTVLYNSNKEDNNIILLTPKEK